MTQAFSPRPSQDAEKPAASLASLFRAENGEALLALMLASGGDERIALCADGRNPYFAPIRPTTNEAWFASSTASAISPRGWRAAEAALPRAFSAAGAEDWFGALRQRLLAALAIEGADAVFCASGTQAEYMALVAARGLDGAKPKKIRNILVAPGETGRGAPFAASGKHFLGSAPFGPSRSGALVEGWSAKGVSIATLAIRDAAGAPLTCGQIDAEAESLARDGVAQGARVLLHVLDCSKTQLSGLSRATARKLLDEFPENICVVVDACQLRSPPETIRADLADGFMVMVSGSKFAGGPAFSGALLLPPEIMRRLARRPQIAWPAGLASHAAALDWPPALREKIPGPFGARANPGLGLRWEAALAEYELYLSHDAATVATAVMLFGERARNALARSRSLRCDDARGSGRTIFTIFSHKFSGEALPSGPILDALRARGLHLGQPVRIGPRDALRLCLSAPQINDFALRLRAGADEAAAFAPLAQDMEALFDKWNALIAGE